MPNILGKGLGSAPAFNYSVLFQYQYLDPHIIRILFEIEKFLHPAHQLQF
jgi:hypothetical protein